MLEYRQVAVQPALVMLANALPPVVATLKGVAAPFESWSRDLEQRKLTEKIIRTAFDETITLIKEGRKVVDAYVNHNPKAKLTDTRTGLRLRTTDRGLEYEMDLQDTPIGNAVKRLAQEQKVSGVSIGFKRDGERNIVTNKDTTDPQAIPSPKQSEGSIDGTDRVIGTGDVPNDKWEVLTNIDLREISILTQGALPAYRGTSVELKDGERALQIKQFIGIYDALI